MESPVQLTTLAELMPRHPVMLSPDDTLATVRELFHKHHFHHLLVVEHHRLVGIVSDRDLLRNISPFVGNIMNERGQDLATLHKRVHQIMSRKLVTAHPSTIVEAAIELILTHDISCLPVVDDHMRPISIVTWRDLLRVLSPLPAAIPSAGSTSDIAS